MLPDPHKGKAQVGLVRKAVGHSIGCSFGGWEGGGIRDAACRIQDKGVHSLIQAKKECLALEVEKGDLFER